VSHGTKRLLVWAIVVVATVILNAIFHVIVRLDGCTPGVGYGVPMGGGECQPFSEGYFGILGFLTGLWFFLIGWPLANLLLGLFLCKKFDVSKLLVFAVIFVFAPATIAISRTFYPLIFQD
jgi:hypothetical protein